jgi:hypothetical protein
MKMMKKIMNSSNKEMGKSKENKISIGRMRITKIIKKKSRMIKEEGMYLLCLIDLIAYIMHSLSIEKCNTQLT